MNRSSSAAASRRADPLAPRKRPAQRRSAATVEAILEAAARILETAGFEGYTTNAVAERAGVSIGSLYQYFPNRDALTAALIDRETATLVADVQEAGKAPSCEGTLRLLIRGAVRHQTRRPVLARLIDFEERRLPLGEREQHVADTIVAILREAFTRADAPPLADPATAAADVLAMTRGMIDAAGEQDDIQEDSAAAALEQRVMRAVVGYLFRQDGRWPAPSGGQKTPDPGAPTPAT